MTIPPPAEIRRIVYLGTPEVAVPPLRALAAAGYDIALVVSGEDKRRGRGRELRASPVKEAAIELDVPVSADVEAAADVGADLGVVVAYGRLIPAALLDDLAFVNVHFSLLPRWRGAAPVERAILAGDEKTGVSLMVVDRELDTGAVYRREEVAIGADETRSELTPRLVELGTKMLIEALGEGLGVPEPQTGVPVYAAKLEPDELNLDWTRPAAELHRVVRVGGAWTTFRDKRLKIHRAEPVVADLEPGQLDGLVVGTGSAGLRLLEVQPEGRSVQSAADWQRGSRPAAGEHLGP